MCLDTKAITGLPCLEEALDRFRDAGLLSFVTDKEHWNEEILLQFYATLHIRGYNRDIKTWILEWMTGNVSTKPKLSTSLSLQAYPLPENSMNLVVKITEMLWKASSISLNPI